MHTEAHLKRPYQTPSIQALGCVEEITQEQDKDYGPTDGFMFRATPVLQVEEDEEQPWPLEGVILFLMVVVGLPLLLLAWVWARTGKSPLGWGVATCAAYFLPFLAFSILLYDPT